MTRAVRLAGLTGLAAVAVMVVVGGGRDLQPAGSIGLAAWSDWASTVDPITLTVAVVRLVAALLALWIGTSALAQLVLVLHPSDRTRRWVDRVSPRLVRVAAGSSLSLALLAGPSPTSGADDPGAHQATMRPVPADESSTTAPPIPVPTTTTSTPTTIPPTTIPPTTTTALPPLEPPAPAPAPVAPAPPTAAGPERYVVERADSLWSIAADALGDRLGRPALDREVLPYWLEVVAADADRLIVPGNADLIYPGQELVLPA